MKTFVLDTNVILHDPMAMFAFAGSRVVIPLTVIEELDTFKRFNLPILIGASRKRFIDSVSPSAPLERVGGSLAAHLLAVRNGAAIIRTHDVAETIQAIKVDNALRAIK